jgi:hypothetical protein
MASTASSSNVPFEFVDIFDKLRTEIVWLHVRWLTYRDLFAESPQRVALLTESAGLFFFILHDLFIDEIQICLSKLTDPAKIRKYENLSLECLQAKLDQFGDPKLATKCRTLLDTIHDQCQVFRVRRDKTLAHLDLQTAMKQLSTPLPGVSRQMISDALKSTRDYMNLVDLHYNESEMAYEHFIGHDGAPSLLATLRAGLRYDELIKTRVLPPDDWQKGQWNNA